MSEVMEDPVAIQLNLEAALGADAQMDSLEWRLDHLYWIVNKDAKAVPFDMNDQQRNFIQNIWYRNLILKARQLGFSTLLQVLELDQAMMNGDFNCVVIADTLPNAGKLFKKVEFAYDHLPDLIKQMFPILRKNQGSEIVFGHMDADGKLHPSTISVSVSARGGTVQLLHVSELGKIALKFPQRAEEIKTGAFEAVPQDGCIVVESTAEGAFGLFYELCEPAIKRRESGAPETVLDWRLHFYPWFDCKDYRLSDEDTELVEIPSAMTAYFRKLEAELKITIDRNQRAWYAKKAETQGKKMKQEYPATPKEAFEQAIEGAVYGDQMTWLREHGRLGRVPLDPIYPVNTFWDFGVNDANTIWFHQQIGLQHRWFYYIEGNGKGLKHWWMDVCEKHRLRHGYTWGKHYLPHDADAEILGEVVTTKHRILEKLGMRNIVVVPRIATIGQGIEITRTALVGNHWFDDHKPDEALGEDMGAGNGIRCLDGYQFTWNEKTGVWSAEPLHNWASHGADGWRQYAQGYQGSGAANTESLKKFKNRERRWR
ncbi:MAG: terminase [Paucibacter sp.]|nr:terminase [Roseateles sp.]